MYNNNYVVNNREVKLIEEDWDILVILDACRFDFFKDVYREIFKEEGNLKKAMESPEELGKKARERIINMFPIERREGELVKIIRNMTEGR